MTVAVAQIEGARCASQIQRAAQVELLVECVLPWSSPVGVSAIEMDDQHSWRETRLIVTEMVMIGDGLEKIIVANDAESGCGKVPVDGEGGCSIPENAIARAHSYRIKRW